MKDYNRAIETLTGFLKINNGLIKQEQLRAKPSKRVIDAYEQKSQDINLALELLNQANSKTSLSEFIAALKGKK